MEVVKLCAMKPGLRFTMPCVPALPHGLHSRTNRGPEGAASERKPSTELHRRWKWHRRRTYSWHNPVSGRRTPGNVYDRAGRLPMTDIPILMGSNGDEGSTFLSASVYSKAGFASWCNTAFGVCRVSQGRVPSVGRRAWLYHNIMLPDEIPGTQRREGGLGWGHARL